MTHAFENDDGPTRIQSINQINRHRLEKGSLRLEKSSQVSNLTEWGMRLEENPVGFWKGANALYRDSKEHNSIQVREYDNYYLIQLDHANPTEGEVLNHLIKDFSPKQKAAVGVAALGALALALSS